MRVWMACTLCAGQPGRDHLCSLCQGTGGWWEGNDDDYSRGRVITDPNDKLAGLLGVLVGGFLAYMAYKRGGFGGDRMWDFVIPIGGAFVAAKIFSLLPRLMAAIRWTIKAAVWIGIAVFIYYALHAS